MADKKPVIRFRRLPHGLGIPQPSYAGDGDAGLDLRAAVIGVWATSRIPYRLAPGRRVIIPTGYEIALPPGTQGEVRGRSGLAVSYGIGIVQGVGTIDESYRGEIKVVLINHGDEDFLIEHGMRIAQLVVTPYVRAKVKQVRDLDETTRGKAGFGSTGLE